MPCISTLGAKTMRPMDAEVEHYFVAVKIRRFVLWRRNEHQICRAVARRDAAPPLAAQSRRKTPRSNPVAAFRRSASEIEVAPCRQARVVSGQTRFANIGSDGIDRARRRNADFSEER
jgi:hypothetical protein